MWAEQGCTGAFAEWLHATRGWHLEVVRHPARQAWRYGYEDRPTRTFEVLPRRCVVERTFSSLASVDGRRRWRRAAGTGDGAKVGSATWEREFDRWLAPFWTALGDMRRRRWGPVYVRGLLGPGERKSVEPLAARVAPDDYEPVHHFVCASCWKPEPLERVSAEKAQALVAGPDAVLIIDDTALLKQGKRSVGVARQYAGAVGKTADCQTLVSLTSLTLARAEVPVCVALRLFLPAEWTDDPARCRAAGVPEEKYHLTSHEAAPGESPRRRLRRAGRRAFTGSRAASGTRGVAARPQHGARATCVSSLLTPVAGRT